MLVYDVTHEKSFENIRNWIRNIEEVSMRDGKVLCASLMSCITPHHFFCYAPRPHFTPSPPLVLLSAHRRMRRQMWRR